MFTALVDALNLAGDMGLLLRVETLVSRQTRLGQTGDLFTPPEERIRAALTRFISGENVKVNTRRQLFAEDAAHGVALLSVAEKKFDVVLMNPPFGPGSLRAKRAFEVAYPRTKNDIFAAFVERGVELLCNRGLLGAITSRTGFFLPSFQQWREQILLADAAPVVVADLGLGVMDAALVEAAAYCLEKGRDASTQKSVFIRTLEMQNDKQSILLHGLSCPSESLGRTRFELEPARFSALSRSPFAYWVGDEVRGLFSALPSVESKGRTAKVGLQTSDDFRFLRLRWETPEDRNRWFLFAKGGAFSSFYADLYLVVNWNENGREIRSFDKAFLRNVEFFGRPGLTWPHRTKSELGFRVLPSAATFGHKGPSVFVEGDDAQQLLALLAIFRSSAFRALTDLQLAAAEPTGRGGAARSYDVGVIQRTPLPLFGDQETLKLANMAALGWRTRRRSDSTNETSLAFTLPSALIPRTRSLDGESSVREIESLETQIDETVFRLYGIAPPCFRVIEPNAVTTSSVGLEADVPEDDEDVEYNEQVGADADTLNSWLVGVAFGRFDPRLATGERPIPAEPEPFDPLPARSPGMYPGGEMPTAHPDIFVDDEGHVNDLSARVRAVAEQVRVDVKEDIRGWLAKEFFPFHVRMYSKSRRKAPIYWQLATPSASYSIWLYIHAFGNDTFFRVQNDYAAPKLAHEERRLDSLRIELRDGATATQRNELAAQETIVEELRSFLEEVKRVTPLWNPNLDDGVIINFAPLWRLVPQNKSWQKELKTTWDSLCDGEYDWAHLAMHLWPERVVPKCAKDRSLAIAHGLEEVFWVEGADGKWTPRKTPARTSEELVRERTSPAVKSALKSLLEAPAATGAAGRRRGAPRRVAAAAERGEA